MSLIPHSQDDFFIRPWEEMRMMERNMNNMLQNNFANNSLTRDFAPLMGTDLIESEHNYSVNVDLPGVAPEDLDISIQDDCLCMQAERKYEHEEKNDRVHSMERSFGKVQRKVRLPKNADLDRVQTSMKNGVLTVTFPKKIGVKDTSKHLQINYEK
jgi:HSP20 family protein